MRLDLTAAEHTNWPRLGRRLVALLAFAVTVNRQTGTPSFGLNRRRAARLAVRWEGRYVNWTLPGHGTVTLIWR